MKRSLWCLLAFLLCCVGMGFCTAPTFVTGATHTCQASSTIAVASINCTISGATAGDFLGYFTLDEGDSGGGSITLTDSSGSPSLIDRFTGSVSVLTARYQANISSGSHTVTLTCANMCNPSVALLVFEYSGAATASPIDTFSTASGTFSPVNSASITTAAADEIVVSFAYDGSAVAFTAATGFALRGAQPASISLAVSDNAKADNNGSGTAGSSIAPSWSISPSSGFWDVLNVAFKASGGGSTPKSVIVGGGIQ